MLRKLLLPLLSRHPKISTKGGNITRIFALLFVLVSCAAIAEADTITYDVHFVASRYGVAPDFANFQYDQDAKQVIASTFTALWADATFNGAAVLSQGPLTLAGNWTAGYESSDVRVLDLLFTISIGPPLHLSSLTYWDIHNPVASGAGTFTITPRLDSVATAPELPSAALLLVGVTGLAVVRKRFNVLGKHVLKNH